MSNSMRNSMPGTSLSADVFRYVRYQVRGRRGLVASGFGAGVAALWFGWPWLVAVGLAPILLALAPCAIMCAVGLCTMKACSTGNATGAAETPTQLPADQTIVSVTATELATAEPSSSTALPPSGPGPVGDEDAAQTERPAFSDELTVHGKAKTR